MSDDTLPPRKRPDSSEASLIKSSALMASGTVVSRITGVGRDVAMTAALGFFIVADAYSLGNTLPNIVYILVVGGALNAVFIPQLVRHMRDDLDVLYPLEFAADGSILPLRPLPSFTLDLP